MNKIKKLLLDIIGEKSIVKYLLDKTKLEDIDDISDYVWQDVYRLVPNIKKWLKKRELALLKSQMLKEKSSDFILGQIYENKLYQRFDIPNNSIPKVVDVDNTKKIPSKDEFIKKWNNE